MKLLSNRARNICAVALLLTPLSAFATNGYFLIGYGPKSRGMGGVGIAMSHDSLAAAHNPASMSYVDYRGAMRIDADVTFFNPPRAVRQDSSALENGFDGSDTGVNHESGANEFLIPSMGMIYKFNRKLTIGFAGVGAGANTRYNQEVPGNPECLNGNTGGAVGSTFFNFNCNADSPTVGATLYQMQMLPSVSYKISKQHAVGASLAFAVSSFRAYGLGAFQDLGFAAGKTNVSGEGNDWSYGGGIRLGWMGRFLDDRLSIGTNYASRVYMTEFDKYKNLFAEQGDFDIPENFGIGMALKLNDKWTLGADITRTMYGDVASIANTGPSVTDPNDLNVNGICKGRADDETPEIEANCKLGGDDGMGFGWENSTIYKIGLNYDYSESLSFRVGYNHGDVPFDNDQVLFNTLAPAVVEDHITVGASYRPSKSIEWSFSLVRALSNTYKGPSAFGPTGDENLDKDIDSVALEMEQTAISVGFAFIM